MKYTIISFLVFLISACSSTKNTEVEIQKVFTVLLTENTTIDQLKKKIDQKIIEAKPVSKSQNMWRLIFSGNEKDTKKIRADLLNLDYVIAVYNDEEFKNLNLKNTQKAKVGPIGKNVEKQ